MSSTTPKRHRGSIGRYLEDFVVGDVYEHFPGRTITETDNIQFSLLTMNFHPMHCDSAFAAKSEFGMPLVNSGLTLAIVLGMTVNDVSGKAIATKSTCGRWVSTPASVQLASARPSASPRRLTAITRIPNARSSLASALPIWPKPRIIAVRPCNETRRPPSA